MNAEVGTLSDAEYASLEGVAERLLNAYDKGWGWGHGSLVAEVERILAARAHNSDVATVTEWGVRGVLPEPDPQTVWEFPRELPARATARHPKYGGTVVSRQRTIVPDVVTEWVEVAQ